MLLTKRFVDNLHRDLDLGNYYNFFIIGNYLSILLMNWNL